MKKYKNKDGIELNLDGMTEAGKVGSGMNLVQEIVSEAIKILDFAPSYKCLVLLW